MQKRLCFALGLLLSGCPAKTDGKPAALPPCTEFGQTCEYLPGKLGSCVQKDDCQGKGCYVCQSQH